MMRRRTMLLSIPVNAVVSAEVGLDTLEDSHRVISTTSDGLVSAQEKTHEKQIDKPNTAVVLRKADGVVECETKELVDFLTTLSTIENVLLNILYNRYERTASTV
jgi:hypothetical protein